MQIQILADSCCDTNPELAAQLAIEKAPLKILVDNQQFIDDDSMDVSALLKAMANSKSGATSACPAPEEYAELMRKHEECVVVTLSSKLSGSFNAARNARDMVLEETPQKKIHIFDSASASAGEVRVALYLKELIDNGNLFEDILKKGEEFIHHMRTLFVLEDLSNLVKNGRLSKVSGIVASILSLCPIMGEDGHGEIKMVSKARGVQNALRKLIDAVNEQTSKAAAHSITLVMAHCNCAERAKTLREQMLEMCVALKEILVVPTAGLSTMYANDGGIILAF